ncbi:MAG: hypothetical protein CL577_09580 [Alteromonadaceae bacterium]|jgi:hypothetical protein|uniref:DUF2333 family protein n=2 Tax=Rheinheimera TaxID=67575 RepID=A0ABP3NQY4_9GAMM|nr:MULTISPECIES: DUF2333 family protein [Rheinheimera]MBJ91965.1 hypothetical protein [Alteromonadaceae bacterium]MBJ92828.1 hypothetical protein [Alteromonadaceae bacterium]MCB5214223.1 DUF2333 family protein [Rheinheimera aquimaris]MCD1597565.1 DUF2333 family protein [Rheinheimera aquimaris]HBN89795.1 DUF2333 domain-containing protein [Rheinheimera sp.]|tara:strand:- start:6460 stop:7437 length:978 start_codon:yes stop_codon:yes gene_type:complete
MLNTKWVSSLLGLVLFVMYLTGWWVSREPDLLVAEIKQSRQQLGDAAIVGYSTTTALIRVSETLLDKSGGYLANDIMPPFVMLDNMPAWELGVLEMSRDLALALRKDFSRSQSQSTENTYLKVAQPMFNIDHRSWAIPSAESEYRKAIAQLYLYRAELMDPAKPDSQFYARADNLRDWLKAVEKRLGSYSQRLSASVGQDRVNTDLAGDASARQSTDSPGSKVIKTSWWKLDDEFYEARGASWALLHFLKAVETDFADVLKRKNAMISLRQIIRELEATQQAVWSPMVLNGSGFGLMANHSLVMANYISRANAALIDLSELLTQG